MKKILEKICKHKYIFTAIIALCIFLAPAVGCASCERCQSDCASELNNGLNRTINIYTYDGELVATYRGKIDIETGHDDYILFHLNGKRYIYYYGISIIEIIEN